MSSGVLQAERMHLAGLLEAIQRCVYFLNASDKKLSWPLTAATLEQNKKNIDLFESLAAINERFAQLQDTLGAAMRHSLLLSGAAPVGAGLPAQINETARTHQSGAAPVGAGLPAIPRTSPLRAIVEPDSRMMF